MNPFELAKNLDKSSGGDIHPDYPPFDDLNKEEILQKVRPVDIPLVIWMADNLPPHLFNYRDTSGTVKLYKRMRHLRFLIY